MKMKKFILLGASMLALSSVTPIASINAQTSDVSGVAITQEQTNQLQTTLDEAISLYQRYYPSADITDIDIHLHQETFEFIVRILGRGETEAYQLIHYNNENFFASRARENDENKLPINVDELASITDVTQNAIDQAQNNNLVNWNLDSDDDDDNDNDNRLEWELTFLDGNSEIEVEVDALTGEITDRDDDTDDIDDIDDADDLYDDDDDDRHYYRQFYSDYSGTRPRVYDDDDWDDDDWDDDDWGDDDWDDDDWDDDDWDDDDWDDDDWDDDDWDDDDWDD